MGNLAQSTGLSREALHKTLSEKGNPILSTLIRFLIPSHGELFIKFNKAIIAKDRGYLSSKHITVVPL